MRNPPDIILSVAEGVCIMYNVKAAKKENRVGVYAEILASSHKSTLCSTFII